MAKRTDVERFLAKLAPPDPVTGCMEWLRARQHREYGAFYLGGKAIGAHRAAWILFRGPIPEGMVVCHRCDNRPCANVEHLFLGTQADNMRDMWAKARACTGDAMRQAVIDGIARGDDHYKRIERQDHGCPNGHPATPENTYTSPTGTENCRECRRTNIREWARRNRALQRHLGMKVDGSRSAALSSGKAGRRGVAPTWQEESSRHLATR